MGCDLFERKHIIYSVITNKYMHSQGALLSTPEIAIKKHLPFKFFAPVSEPQQ
jgi:hypothetical protein